MTALDILPVTLLTGFLGSGKSTLLGRVLRDPRFSDTAVIVNEFGDVGLDGVLIQHSSEQVVEMTSGCLCCTIRGDIRQSLMDLHSRRARGEIPTFSRLVVETTGLADPVPVIQTLQIDPRLRRRFRLAGVVTTVDVLNGDATLDRQREAVKQVAVADRLVLTKSDLARDPASRRDLNALEGRLARLAPGARRYDATAPDFDVASLLDGALHDPNARTPDVRRWLNTEAYARPGPGGAIDQAHEHADGHDAHHGHGHGHDDTHGHSHAHEHGHPPGIAHAHDVNHHDAEISSFVVTLAQPMPVFTFTTALELLLAHRGEDLLRVKGIVDIAEYPGTPAIIHGVQHVFSDPVWLDAWPDEDRRTRIVFITRTLPEETLRSYFEAWSQAGGRRPAVAVERS